MPAASVVPDPHRITLGPVARCIDQQWLLRMFSGYGGLGAVSFNRPINRRAFLHATGLGAAAAALAGCGGVRPTSPAFSGLAGKISGPLITPDQPDYALARRSFNPLFDNRAPAAIAQCRRIEDVQACVSAAAVARAPIAARRGGDSYARYSTPDHALVGGPSELSHRQGKPHGTAQIRARA